MIIDCANFKHIRHRMCDYCIVVICYLKDFRKQLTALSIIEEQIHDKRVISIRANENNSNSLKVDKASVSP